MNLKNQIKNQRIANSLSQEELADEIFVSRQSISNWETGKNYPDIHSLLLLSKLFNISLDELVKGDIDEMKNVICNEDVKRFKLLSRWYGAGFLVMIASVVPFAYYLSWLGFAIWILIVAVAFIPALKIEKIKQHHDIQTYREIVAFMNGEKLDNITKRNEGIKRFQQKMLLMMGSAVIAIIVCLVLYSLISNL